MRLYVLVVLLASSIPCYAMQELKGKKLLDHTKTQVPLEVEEVIAQQLLATTPLPKLLKNKSDVVCRTLKDVGEGSWKLAFSSTGDTMATITHDGYVCLWDMATYKLRRSKAHNGWPHSVVFSSDDTMLITGAEDNKAIVWSVKEGKHLTVFKHKDSVEFVDFTARDTQVVTFSGSTLRIWSLDSKECLHEEKGYWAVLSKQSGLYVLAKKNPKQMLCLYDPLERKVVTSFESASDNFGDCYLSPDGNYLAYFDGDAVKVITVATSESTILMYGLSLGSPYSSPTLCFSPDSSKLLVSLAVMYNRGVEIFDLASLDDEPTLLKHDTGSVISMAFAKDGKRLIAIVQGEGRQPQNLVCIWDMDNYELVHIINESSTDVVFAPDGQLYVCIGRNNTLQVRDFAYWERYYRNLTLDDAWTLCRWWEIIELRRLIYQRHKKKRKVEDLQGNIVTSVPTVVSALPELADEILKLPKEMQNSMNELYKI